VVSGYHILSTALDFILWANGNRSTQVRTVIDFDAFVNYQCAVILTFRTRTDTCGVIIAMGFF